MPRRAPVERPQGLLYTPEFLTPDEEAELLGAIEPLDLEEVRMHGRSARRTVRHFGFDYAFESGEVSPGEPLPPVIAGLRDRCAEVAELEPGVLEQALVTRYPAGAGIGWHRDAPAFGSRVVGVSLLAACRMRFQRGKGESRRVFELELARRSAYVLAGSARWAWQHSIPATDGLRYSITFRSVRVRAAQPTSRG